MTTAAPAQKKAISYREALNQAMREEMQRDPSVFVIGEDVAHYEGAFKVTRGLLREFGDQRVVDTPISEAGFVGLGIGAAMAGLRPIIELMTVNFSILALDQIVNNAAKVRYMFGGQVACPIVIRMPGGAGHQLAAQHSHSLEAWYTHVPGLKVVCPATPYDAKGLLKTAIRDDDPVIFLESEGLYAKKGPVGGPDDLVPFGRAAVRREGRDCTIVAASRMVWVALAAADLLAKEGIECDVIDPRTFRPLDLETLARRVRVTGRAVVVDEGWPECGIAANLATHLYEACFDWLDAPVARVGCADVPMPYARNLEQAALPQAETVAEAVRRLVRRGDR
ncbi:MAG: acetoin:2,6-dichlorophenolindophenol oxidoreductase subunit beta [Miltoncostaeaceae bacterium]|jgi:pyruvate dehydrogenase E1 component beta subunit|nr:acetoin:2,6-dichlorophenolindophenol oxidoreductase subunit beta [Miltoncostaeaceae bacterium]